MYEYKFVKIKLSTFRLEPEEDYEALVNKYAREGWRLMQVLTPPTVGYGTIGYYEFVFERQAKTKFEILAEQSKGEKLNPKIEEIKKDLDI